MSQGTKARNRFISLLPVVLAAQLFVLSQAQEAAGKTYYVDSIGGNDSWDGLSQTYSAPNQGPWKTSNKLNWGPDFLGDDQILFKRGGIYSRLIMTNNYKSVDGHPIIFGAYGSGEKPIVTSISTIVTSWTSLGDGRYTASASLVEVVLEDWHALRLATSSTLAAGDYYIDRTNNLLFYRPSSGVPADHEVRYGSAAAFTFYEKAANFILQDLHFIGSGTYHAGTGPEPFRNITIQRCEFTGNATIYMAATANRSAFNVIVQDNLFKNNRSNMYFVAENNSMWDGLIVRRNRIIDTDIMRSGMRYSSWFPGDIDGISVQNVTNSIFEQNEISGGCSTGGILVWFGLGVAGTGNIVRYNYIHDIDTSGIEYGGEDDGTSNVQIYGNVIANVGRSAPQYGTYWGGIRLNRKQTATAPSRVHNNVIYNADVSFYLYTKSDHYLINNNISSNPRSDKHVIADFGMLHNIFDHNLYFGGTNNFRLSHRDHNFAEWKNLAGQDAHSPIADPKFVNRGSGDFRLERGSPAINAGLNLGAMYRLALDPSSSWPSSVATASQDGFGSGWEIGAFVYKETPVAPEAPVSPTNLRIAQ